jgi:hypothetical protein
MPLFRWEDIDQSLVSLRLTNLAEEMHTQTEADERRIQFENRGNLNGNAVLSLVLKMKQDRADEWAQRVYEIYCEVWQTQGHVSSAAFVRAVYLRGIVPVLRAQTGAIAFEFSGFADRTSFPATIRDAHLLSLRLNMQRLESRWQRRVEIEAKELEHAEATARLSVQTLQTPYVATTKTPPLTGTEVNPQSSGEESPLTTPVLGTRLNRKRPGRSPKLAQPFVSHAGMLWRNAISDSHAKVSDDRLRQIASALDAAGHLPPSAYLEGNCAQELKAFNSRNSNSKTGPVRTWSRLLSLGDKDLLRGMRRLLSRCARKLDDAHLSGN